MWNISCRGYQSISELVTVSTSYFSADFGFNARWFYGAWVIYKWRCLWHSYKVSSCETVEHVCYIYSSVEMHHALCLASICISCLDSIAALQLRLVHVYHVLWRRPSIVESWTQHSAQKSLFQVRYYLEYLNPLLAPVCTILTHSWSKIVHLG